MTDFDKQAVAGSFGSASEASTTRAPPAASAPSMAALNRFTKSRRV